ncbi:ComEC/Rec2 family competence protein [Croceicoccus sp. BE223]|uniref:ComEC/Rec2 family competence protein n=1 Tax=Croceicoccus sp. BE223 TaxID=2817716 RepID=UPI00285995C6|nr:ComEC/Rec2 family competence protein [Croceicoccus sp. BE223]MDR7103348.1 competence protein ComEC [Croceicoccus sp. BE223]
MIWWDREDLALLRGAVAGVALMAVAGLLLIWARSEAVGTPAIGRPIVGEYAFRVLAREETGRLDRPLRVLIAARIAGPQSIRARISVDKAYARPDLVVGASGTAKMRLIAPSRPVVPGAYDPARAAWFDGVAAVGSFLGAPDMRGHPGRAEQPGFRERLGGWVSRRTVAMGGSEAAAAIAETLVTGNRTGLSDEDTQAMRDAGLAHLLSISGLHVGAVIAVVWFVAMRGLGLFPWLALRLPLPLVASLLSAGAGIGYTLLTGAELPTIRACIAAILVLLALALGRRALSLRLIAVAAITVLLFWPEAAISPSFQMSFAAVVAIVALHNAGPVERWRERGRTSGPIMKWGTWLGLLFLTAIVVELTLMPLVLFHFQRTGVYGSLVNLVAIPLTTVVIMPAIGLAMLLDAAGLGAAAWWAGGMAIDVMLGLARFAASRPGAVIVTSLIPLWPIVLCCVGGFWLALWSGRARLLGTVPYGLGLTGIAMAPPPDVLIAGDGRQVVVTEGGDAYRAKAETRFDDKALFEMAGTPEARIRHLADRPETSCAEGPCTFALMSPEGPVRLIYVRGAAASRTVGLSRLCGQVAIAISPDMLPDDCRPTWLRLDERELARQGGAIIDIDERVVRRARPDGDRHGW